VFKNNQTASGYYLTHQTEYNAIPSGSHKLRFTSNHDENSWNGTEWERMGNATEVLTVFTYVIPGMPLVYSGQEAGSSKRLKFFEKDPIEWKDHPFFGLYQKLNQLKKENPALWNPGFGGTYTRLATQADKQVLAFKRELGTNSVIAVLNLSNQQASVTLSAEIAGGRYVDYFSGNRVKPADQPISLEPWGYAVYTKKCFVFYYFHFNKWICLDDASMIKLFFYFLVLAIYYFAFSNNDIEMSFQYGDKLKHIFAFTVLFLIANKAFHFSLFLKMGLIFSMGVSIELIQYFLPNRSFDIMDLIANTFGLLLGYFINGMVAKRIYF